MGAGVEYVAVEFDWEDDLEKGISWMKMRSSPIRRFVEELALCTSDAKKQFNEEMTNI